MVVSERLRKSRVDRTRQITQYLTIVAQGTPETSKSLLGHECYRLGLIDWVAERPAPRRILTPKGKKFLKDRGVQVKW